MGKPVYLDYNATTPIDPEAIEEMLPYFQTGFGNPSSSYSIGSENLGVANQKKANEITTYNAFSVTKTFTALAILQLAEKGKIDIDKSAAIYIDNFPYSGDITLRHLLTHTARIPNPNPLPWIHPANEHQVFDRDAFFGHVFDKHNKVKSLPDKMFAYSNLGYVLLGQLIEQVTGMKYETYIREYIFKPMGLSKAKIDFEVSDPTLQAKGYNKKKQPDELDLIYFEDHP